MIEKLPGYQWVSNHTRPLVDALKSTRVDMPSPKQAAGIVGFAAATGILGYFTGQGIIDRFSERPQVVNQIFLTRTQLRDFNTAYNSSDDPELRTRILESGVDVARTYVQSLKRIDEMDEHESTYLLIGLTLTMASALGVAGSLPIRRVQRLNFS